MSNTVKVVADDNKKKKWDAPDVFGWTKRKVITLDADDYPEGTEIEFTEKKPED